MDQKYLALNTRLRADYGPLNTQVSYVHHIVALRT